MTVGNGMTTAVGAGVAAANGAAASRRAGAQPAAAIMAATMSGSVAILSILAHLTEFTHTSGSRRDAPERAGPSPTLLPGRGAGESDVHPAPQTSRAGAARASG